MSSAAASVSSTRPASPRSSETARRSTAATPASSRPCSSAMSDRLNSGAMTEKCGFSVVAATSRTMPFSTAASRASCWLLENRCTSSMNRTVR